MAETERRRRGKRRAAEQDLGAAAESTESAVRDLEDVYGGMRDRLCGILDLPEDFGTHMRAARKEFLLAVRSLIDARIEALDEAAKQRETARRGRVQID